MIESNEASNEVKRGTLENERLLLPVDIFFSPKENLKVLAKQKLHTKVIADTDF